jgi:hypothetical protein
VDNEHLNKNDYGQVQQNLKNISEFQNQIDLRKTDELKKLLYEVTSMNLNIVEASSSVYQVDNEHLNKNDYGQVQQNLKNILTNIQR